MASGYNLVGRPPVVAVADGRARLLVRRESAEDLRSRDVGL
jgi:diaminopimelate decarboxylase